MPRGPLLIALLVTVGVGLASRLWPTGWYLFDKSLGDLLYAVAVYLVLGLVAPGRTIRQRALLAALLCFGIELFQLTGWVAGDPRLRPLRWLLGTTFAWHDVVCYGVGVLVIAGLERGWQRLNAGGRPGLEPGTGGG